jgi:hypothetical protein
MGCFQTGRYAPATTAMLRHWRAFVSQACDRKSMPPALPVVVDSECQIVFQIEPLDKVSLKPVWKFN